MLPSEQPQLAYLPAVDTSNPSCSLSSRNSPAGAPSSSLPIATSFNLQVNDISISTGHFVSKLLTTRLNYNFSTKMFANALVQYNTDNRQWTSNLRFNIIHRPLSDIFIVYNERRDDRTGLMLSRAVIAKMTYMVAF